jgi:hypothetical protein
MVPAWSPGCAPSWAVSYAPRTCAEQSALTYSIPRRRCALRARPATWPGHIMYQADGRPRRWRYFIVISSSTSTLFTLHPTVTDAASGGLAGILYLAQWYNADPDARRAAGILASHLCRVDAEKYARVDFSSFDACMGYYARLREPVPQCVPPRLQYK